MWGLLGYVITALIAIAVTAVITFFITTSYQKNVSEKKIGKIGRAHV